MIVGTAGHIDHGKTALVRAITGVDTDRLPEEKRRGITIALGFAPLTLGGLGTVGLVDVPGHEAFVRTMLAGASGIDCALLVVAADEGPMPQTREHLAILRLLGVPRLVVALTKADLADAELRELVQLELRELLGDSPYAQAPLVPCSAITGEGVETLRDALAAALADASGRETGDLFRLPVDRSFSVAGAGTVVTGTAWSGAVSVGETVRVLPSGRTARVRSLESHGRPVPASAPGARLALALVGLDRQDIGPGDVLVSGGAPWQTTRVLRADIQLLADATPLGVRSRVRLHVGTAEVGARVVVAGGRLAPGEARPARLVLDSPVVVRSGDRFVLRGGTPHTTIGGGVVTDPFPPTPRAKPWPSLDADPRQRLAWMLAESGASGVSVETLPLRLGLTAAAVEKLLKGAKGVALVGSRLVATVVMDGLRTLLLERVDATHRDSPLAPGLDLQTARAALSANTALADEVIRRAERAGLVETAGSALRRPGWDPAAALTALDRTAQLRERLERAGPEPPSVAELRAEFGEDVPALLRLLERDGSAIPVSIERWFASGAVRALFERLRAGTEPSRRYSPSELRELLGISRKYLIPFLEWCDRRGIARRSEDGRTFPAIPDNPA